MYWLRIVRSACPADKLNAEDGKAVYTPECIQCGHCVAVCPRKAVSIPKYDMEDVEEYDKETFTVDPDHFLHAVKFRRSIRNYRNEPVLKDVMERILEAGRYTPTAKNRQACLFFAADNPLDGGLAAANIENMAVAEGAGVLYSGYIQRISEAWKPLKEWLGLGDTTAACCMLIGYPAAAYQRTAPRKKAEIEWR